MVQIGKKAAAGPKKAKKALSFVIDCSKPVEDKVRRRRRGAVAGGGVHWLLLPRHAATAAAWCCSGGMAPRVAGVQ